MGRFARRSQTKGHSHWPAKFVSSFRRSLSLAQFPPGSEGEDLVLGFGRRESCSPGTHRSDERETASLSAFHYPRDCIGNVGVGAFFGAGGVALCSPIPALWFLPPGSLRGKLGEPISGARGSRVWPLWQWAEPGPGRGTRAWERNPGLEYPARERRVGESFGEIAIYPFHLLA